MPAMKMRELWQLEQHGSGAVADTLCPAQPPFIFCMHNNLCLQKLVQTDFLYIHATVAAGTPSGNVIYAPPEWLKVWAGWLAGLGQCCFTAAGWVGTAALQLTP